MKGLESECGGRFKGEGGTARMEMVQKGQEKSGKEVIEDVQNELVYLDTSIVVGNAWTKEREISSRWRRKLDLVSLWHSKTKMNDLSEYKDEGWEG